jgi:hypothetical protein
MDRDELERQLQRGIDMARDPRNAHVRDPLHPRVTTLYSSWLLQTCLRCQHTFRIDDRVLPHPSRPERMLHEDPETGLVCYSRLSGRTLPQPQVTPINPEVHAAFLRGLEQSWRPTGNVQLIVVPPKSLYIGRKCPICRHTVRKGDTIVRCPCGRPECSGVFHQDVQRHLTCWDTWSVGMRRQHCAFTGAPITPRLTEER